MLRGKWIPQKLATIIKCGLNSSLDFLEMKEMQSLTNSGPQILSHYFLLCLQINWNDSKCYLLHSTSMVNLCCKIMKHTTVCQVLAKENIGYMKLTNSNWFDRYQMVILTETSQNYLCLPKLKIPLLAKR